MNRKTAGAALIVLSALLMSGLALAGDQPVDTTKKSADPKHQSVCPVMGGKIDSSEYTDIQGQRVYHCCGGCQKKLVADPDKYFKKAAEQGVIFENIQKHCPVSGKALTNKEFFTDYQGRRIYFADKDGMAKINTDPAKYLKVLDQQTKEDYPEKAAVKGGHDDKGR